MTDVPTAAQNAAFLEDEENVESLTEAVRELSQICRNGTADRPPRGILPNGTLQTMTQEDHSQIAGHFNPTPFCYSRPDILDAHIFAMRAACRIGVDLSEGRDFTPTED